MGYRLDRARSPLAPVGSAASCSLENLQCRVGCAVRSDTLSLRLILDRGENGRGAPECCEPMRDKEWQGHIYSNRWREGCRQQLPRAAGSKPRSVLLGASPGQKSGL